MTTQRRLEKQLRAEENPQPSGPSGSLPRVELRTGRPNKHPWIFRRMLNTPSTNLPPGTLVDVISREGRLEGRGIYNANSEITIRLLTENPQEMLDERWFAGRIARAVSLRKEVLKLEAITDSYRVIHSEADGLSGLVVDKFGPALSIELFSAGMHRHLDWILKGLDAQFPNSPVMVRADHRSEKHEGVKMEGPPPPKNLGEIVIKEGPAQFRVDLQRGHKTGFFLDQRENRARVAELCRGHEFFDGFCYSGGFAVMAALAGAKRVEAVDLDENAIEMGNKNKQQNKLGDSLEFRHGDVFNVLRNHRTANKKFARMILDPAKQAVSRAEIPKAAAAYQDMNRLGMQCVEPGGMLVSCSCTGLISEEEFLDVLRAAAVQAGVELQFFHISGAPTDHPVAGFVPEGRYLKAVYSRVWPIRR